MALEDYNSLTIERLEALLERVEAGDSVGAKAVLDGMAEAGVAGEELSEPRTAVADDDLESVEQWAREHLQSLQGVSDAFSVSDFSFDLDDAFDSLEGEKFPAGPSDVSGDIGGDLDLDSSDALLLSEPVDEPVADPLTVEAQYDDVSDGPNGDEEPDMRSHARGKVLTGKFNIPKPDDVLSGKAKALESESSGPLDDSPMQPASSTARYDGEEPPPPTHRLRATADLSGEIATGELDVSEAGGEAGLRPPDDRTPFAPGFAATDDDFDFDLGLENPEATRSAKSEPAAVEASDDGEGAASSSGVGAEPEDHDEDPGEDDFDLGFQNRAEQSSVAADEEPGSRARVTTPRASPAALGDDMMFELAEDLASMSSSADQYRGEPLGTGSSGRFSDDAPTGTNISALEAAKSVVAGDADVATNLNAILMEARRLRAAGELKAALSITKKVLSRDDNAEAKHLRDEIESALESECLSVLGPLFQTPRLDIDMSELASFDIDHRANFLISQIDGFSTYDDLVEVSGMPRTEALSVFVDLVEKGIIVAE